MKDGSQSIKEVAGYELISKIGQGGMGAVFKARQKSLDRVVALKLLPPSFAKDTKFIERFQREARACAKLNHPNIVQGVDVGQDPASGVWYFAMEFVEGPSVLKLLKTEKIIPEKRALEIGLDIAKALDCAASQGIVHRDIKPDNILLTDRGEAKLADLGLAKQVKDDSSLTQSGQAVGTPFYMAPEQVRGRADQYDIRTDIYALGGTLFHLVTGQQPYSGETSAVIMAKHLTEPVPKAHKVNPEVSEDCSRLIERMMQKDREKRVQSPKDLIEQIERVLRGEGTAGPKLAVKTGAISRRKKDAPEKEESSKMPLILGGVGVAVVAVALIAMNGSKQKPPIPVENESPKVAVAPTPPAPAPVAQPVKEPKRSPPNPVKTPTPPPQNPDVAPTTPEVIEPAKPTPAVAVNAEPAIKEKSVPDEKVAVQTTPATSQKQKAAPAAPETAAKEKLPLADILTALHENAPKKAQERLAEGNFASKDAVLEALKVLDTQREARIAAITGQIGQNVKLDTLTKGSQNGKLVALKNNVLHCERVMIINGEQKGSTPFTVPLEELTPATLDRIAPVPAPAAPADWLASALTALAGGQLDAADAALGHLTGNELQPLLAAEVKSTRVKEREASAKAAWAKIETRAAEAPSQTKAKQLLDELTAFSKKFSDSDFAASPEIAAKITELKEKFERLSLGLDPRVLQLFKGRVLNYDARTQVITLGYDLQTREQGDDFIDSTWAPPGDQTGLTWKKGELRTFCKGTADRIFRMPQFASATLNIQLHYKKIDTSRRNRFEVDISFYGMDSIGKSQKIFFKASEKAAKFISKDQELKATDDILFRTDGVLDVSCQGNIYTVKENNKVILEYTTQKPNDHSGFWMGGGWDSGITFTRMQVSGRLDPAWLAEALKSAPKAR